MLDSIRTYNAYNHQSTGGLAATVYVKCDQPTSLGTGSQTEHIYYPIGWKAKTEQNMGYAWLGYT
jgi:hypothetical protein